MVTSFKDISEISKNKFAESNLGKQAEKFSVYDSGKDVDKSIADVNIGKKGGSYKDVHVDGEGDRYEVHHMPADSVSKLDRNDGPAIKMDKADHRQTSSCGTSIEAQEFRNQQKKCIGNGQFDKALQMDIDDIHAKFGDKYDEGIAQMKDYVKQLKKEGEI